MSFYLKYDFEYFFIRSSDGVDGEYTAQPRVEFGGVGIIYKPYCRKYNVRYSCLPI